MKSYFFELHSFLAHATRPGQAANVMVIITFEHAIKCTDSSMRSDTNSSTKNVVRFSSISALACPAAGPTILDACSSRGRACPSGHCWNDTSQETRRRVQRRVSIGVSTQGSKSDTESTSNISCSLLGFVSRARILHKIARKC